MSRSAQRHDAGSGSPGPRIRPQEGYPGRERVPLPTRVDDLSALPDAYGLALDAGLTELGLAPDGEARTAIDAHVRLLLAWTGAINLTAVREPADVARLHVLDSLTALPLLRERRLDRLVDLGSGGGFPGLPLALALPARATLLVDSVRKKAAFLRVAAAAVDPAGKHGISVASERVEALARDRRHRGGWPVVTVRAVAPLAELVELAFPLLQVGGILVAWKRGALEAELEAGERAAIGVGGGRIDEVREVGGDTLPGHRLVVVVKTAPTAAAFPRDPAERRRRPW